MPTYPLTVCCLAVFAAAWLPQAAHAQLSPSICGSVTSGGGGAGPWDYRSNRSRWGIVESFHFTAQVEALIRGQSGSIGQDIAYTLDVFPNHHRALLAAMRLAEREKKDQPSDFKYSIDCHFERALGFARDDNVTRLIYATHLAKTNRKALAVARTDEATALAGDNAFTHYNAGLIYLDLGEHEKALRQAHKANELGMTNPALQERLKAAGKWQEPASTPASPALAPAPAASSAGQANKP